jgi:hypothetical protein
VPVEFFVTGTGTGIFGKNTGGTGTGTGIFCFYFCPGMQKSPRAKTRYKNKTVVWGGLLITLIT